MQSNHSETCDIGLVGLGVMGRNFARNMADHGFTVAGFNRDPVKIEALEKTKAERHNIHTTGSIEALCDLVRRPRAIMMLVPAGDAVDNVIEDLLPFLTPGDLIIDSGNSHFEDTDRRSRALAEKQILFMGMGMSGGAEGARNGPSLMPGGPEEGWQRIRPIMEAAAAHTGALPCVAYLGPGSAGHYVKMVHNGIEYALMQLIAESYDLLHRGLGLHPNELHMIYSRWNRHYLNSYLMEITADIFLKTDDRTGRPLIDMIRDQAEQKGTGEWSAADALRRQVPALNIAAAVMMRHLSGDAVRRQRAEECFDDEADSFTGDIYQFIDRLENGLYAAYIITYAQGMLLLHQASRAYGYHLDLKTVARIWTGGCIIRAGLLEQIQTALNNAPDSADLLTASPLDRALQVHQADLRTVVRTGIDLAIPVPGLATALTYWDAYRSRRLPANLIMAQRDYFGAHTYERMDAEGSFHTQWDKA